MKKGAFGIGGSFVLVLFILSSLIAFGGPVAAAGTEGYPGNLQFNEEFFVPGEFILKFKTNVPQFVVDGLVGNYGITVLQTNSRGVMKVNVPKGKSVEQMVDIFSKNPNVEYAQPNYICQAEDVPNDPLYSDYQWNLQNGTGGINAEDAWDTSNGSGAVVAILDTGIAYETRDGYYQAPDLAVTNIIAGYDFINNDAYAYDDNSHGTHVAGTIAQSTNNGIGVAGVAYGATLMPVKVLDANGSGTSWSLANGLYWAANNGADIANMSLGWGVYKIGRTWYAYNPGPVVQEAIEYAYNHDVTLVAAAGNDGKNVVTYPAAYEQCISVGATTSSESLASFTNWGSTLDLTAPGQSILQQTFNPNTRDVSDFGYWYFSGTSMATPHVAGVAALLVSLGVEGPEQIKQILYETATDHGTEGWDSQYGWGIVNAFEAVSSIGGSINNPPAAMDDDYTVIAGNILNVAAPGVLINDSDPDSDPLTAALLSDVSHGTLVLNADGSFTYNPASGYSGIDTFTYKANDGTLDSGTATVSITINSAVIPDFSISASPVTRNVKRGGSTSYMVTLTSIGEYNSSVTLSVTGGPTDVTPSFSPNSLVPNGTSVLTFTTGKSTLKGTYALIITGTDGEITHDTTVTLNVR